MFDHGLIPSPECGKPSHLIFRLCHSRLTYLVGLINAAESFANAIKVEPIRIGIGILRVDRQRDAASSEREVGKGTRG